MTRIEDDKGNIIYSAVPHRTEVIGETAYYNMLYMLQNVINNGTARALRGAYGLTAEMGGKTGTTNSNSDTWFVGFTPNLVTGIWIGGEERYIHFNNMAYGQGAKASLPVFGLFMKKIFNDPKLPAYTQSLQFEFPAEYSPCDGGGYYSSGGDGGSQTEEIEEVVESALE